MLEVLREHLLEKPELLYLEEMAVFLRDEFDVQAAHSSAVRSKYAIWIWKKTRGPLARIIFSIVMKQNSSHLKLVIPHCTQGS
jgi:hypothetical protein